MTEPKSKKVRNLSRKSIPTEKADQVKGGMKLGYQSRARRRANKI